MQLLSQVFSIKMRYRQLITITLSIYKNFSLGKHNHQGIDFFARHIGKNQWIGRHCRH